MMALTKRMLKTRVSHHFVVWTSEDTHIYVKVYRWVEMSCACAAWQNEDATKQSDDKTWCEAIYLHYFALYINSSSGPIKQTNKKTSPNLHEIVQIPNGIKVFASHGRRRRHAGSCVTGYACSAVIALAIVSKCPRPVGLVIDYSPASGLRIRPWTLKVPSHLRSTEWRPTSVVAWAFSPT